MKRYIKPNTEMHVVELQNMIAGTVNWESETKGTATVNDETKGTATVNEGPGNGTILGKETEITSTSVWDEEEE